MPDRISIDRKEFQAFVAENQELVQRYQKLLDNLSSLNKDLEKKLRFAEQKLNSVEQKVGPEVQQGDELLRKARAGIARLLEETERHLSQ